MKFLEFVYDSQRALLNLKQTSVSLSVGDREVYAFDLDGKPLSFWMSDATFIWALDGRVIKKWRDLESRQKQIREVDPTKRESILKQSRSRFAEMQAALERGSLEFIRSDDSLGNAGKLLKKWLGKFLAWDSDRLERQKRAFASVYSPVTILPPDQYLTLVLQVTFGCHWNRCTFCDFYRTIPFHVRSMEEFAQHIQAVKSFFGDAIYLRRSIFLGDANALVLPQVRLLRVFDQINQEFSFANAPSSPRPQGPIFQGIHSFLDVFGGERKSEADFRELKQRHLRRVYLGVETGCDSLLAFLQKPTTSKQASELVTKIKGAGLALGLIVLIGPGGEQFSDSHVEETIALVRRLPLGPEDVIYLSPLYTSPHSEYVRLAREARIRALTPEEMEEQTKRIRAGLASSHQSGPRLARYDIREFVY